MSESNKPADTDWVNWLKSLPKGSRILSVKFPEGDPPHTTMP